MRAHQILISGWPSNQSDLSLPLELSKKLRANCCLLLFYMDGEDSDQNGWMPCLNGDFVGTHLFVGFVKYWPGGYKTFFHALLK